MNPSITNNLNPNNSKSIIYCKSLLKLAISSTRKPTETTGIGILKIISEETISIVVNKRNKDSGRVRKKKSISSKIKLIKKSTILRKTTSIT